MKRVLVILIMAMMLAPMVSAVWWNPFTWFQSNEIINPYELTVIEDTKQEVDATIEYIDFGMIEITLDDHPSSTTGQGYKWDAVLCSAYNGGITYFEEDAQGGFENSVPINKDYVKLSDYGMNEDWCKFGYGYTLFSSGSKNQFPKKFRVNVSDLNAFKIYAGTGSVEIDGYIMNYSQTPPTYFSDWYFGDNAAHYNGITMIPMENLTHAYEASDFVWNATNDTNGGFWVEMGVEINLTEFHWNVSSLTTERVCTSNFYGSKCTYEELDFSSFISKNNITNWTINNTGNYTMVSFYGTITDLDPSFTVASYSTGDGWFNATEASDFGVRLDTPVLSMPFDEENVSTRVRDRGIYGNNGTMNGGVIYNSSCGSPAGGGLL